ncbi:MAG TPA: glutaredoxin domain-containing protein [Gaiellaceae bacterium]|jgi:monothiol glutaredoxin|nr:glutaredoxin domain-containing protein [Gaiellaceae bacterium]
MSELREQIRETIEREPVVAFVKGTHEQAYCGNSERAMQALRAVGASFAAVDVLPDPAIRQELSALSSWPTIPQVFVGGELIGGADIVQELAASGELEAKLDEKLGGEWRNRGAERTVALSERGNPFRIVG